ncbi:uncharacterized protein LOC111128961 isoform X2 [Crassostrea virginica]
MEGMLELLSTTDAAVKALDRSQASTSSRSSSGSKKKSLSENPDSGIGKTEEKSQKTLPSQTREVDELDLSLHSSDVSTTASDVLIRSTTAAPGERGVLDDKSFQSVDNTSNISKCSKHSFGKENFNSSGPVKVKVSSKLLREIKSPYESPREDTDAGKESPKIQNGCPDGASGKSKEQRSSKEALNLTTGSKASSRGGDNSRNQSGASEGTKHSSRPNSATSKSSTGSKPGSVITGQTSKPVHNISKTNIQQVSTKPVSNNPKDIITLQSTPQGKQSRRQERNGPGTPEKQGRAGGFPQPVFVERHTPEKVSRDMKVLSDDDDKGSYLDDFIKEQSESQDMVPEKLVTESVETSIHSATSSQPEIVTVPERIITVSTRSSVSSDQSLSDSAQILTIQEQLVTVSAPLSMEDDSTMSQREEDEKIPPRLPDKFHQYTAKYHSHGLKQGSESSAMSVVDQVSDSGDIHVEKFNLSEKQRLMKENFTKRLQVGPKKRVVQPRLIGPAAKTSKKETESGGGPTSEALTAAVAASAAIAATQPFLKAQQELENKMTNILNQIAGFQSGVAPPLKGESESERVAQLEKQLATVTEQRIQHLEKLQEHQVAMQAKLLSLSRTPQNKVEMSRSKSPTIRSPSRSPPLQRKREVPPKPVTKTTVPQLGHGEYHQEWFQEQQSPETPKPRTNPPKPLSFEFKSKKQPSARGILEEILASDGSPRRDIPEPTKYQGKDKLRGECVEKSPAVKRAENLLHRVEDVKEKLQHDLANSDKIQKDLEEKKLKDTEYDKKLMEKLHGPSPLDPYLLPSQKDLKSPYKKAPTQHEKAPVGNPSSFWDAALTLQEVRDQRATLEANLEAVFRTRQEAEVYTIMETLYQEGNNSDLLRIRKMVDKKIGLLRSQVEREVTDDVILAELQKKEAPVFMKSSQPSQAKPVPYAQRATGRAKVGAKVDTGLSKIKGPSFGPPPSKTVKGKENKPSILASALHKPPAAKPKLRTVVEDENYMTKVYGKASYQNKRTTVKDPYLHYQNDPKHKPDRPPGAPDVANAHLVKSAKTQTAPGIKQFYFSPTHGTYIPVTSAQHAPIQGQLVPMAVPLSGPRMESGLTYSASPPPGPLTTSTPASQPPVSALKNVALVSVPVEDDLRKPPEPELGKQVLPSVDIDTDISETSPIPKSRLRSKSPEKLRSQSSERDVASRASTQHGEVQLRSPPKSPSRSRLEVTFHREEDEETLTDVSGDLNPEDAPGIALPGHHPPSPPPVEDRHPVFPQQKLLDHLNPPVVSDVLAEDIRRRDNLEKKAAEWLQQELLAKMISDLCPTEVEEEPAPGLPHFVDEDSIESEVEDKEQSMFVMDSIGRAGMQLFVDAGQPVDSDLVNNLIRQVLVEKVVTMLGQRPSEEGEGEERAPPKMSATVEEDMMGTTEPSPREYLYSPDQIETPQPTPKATPIASPTRVISPPVTPELSPPLSPRQQEVRVEPRPEPWRPTPPTEPESEASESLDLSEELRILKQKLVIPMTAQSVDEVHDIETPVATPVPEEEPPQELLPMSPPPPTPRPVESPPKVVEPPPPVEVRTVEPPTIREETTLKVPQEEIQTSPKPWADPASPRPEENPEYRDPTEPDQPQPMILTTAEPVQEERRSPSPKRQKSPVREPSPAPSITESVTESSVSDTINQSVSEGQWLLNKSEGEVADFPIDEVTRQRALEKALRLRAEQSMASTLKDTSEIPDESTEFPISEGEFQYNPAIPPEKDPVLLLLSKLQHGPIHPGQLDMTSAQVSDLLDHTGTSTGDLSMNQLRASVDRSLGEVRPKKQRRPHASPEREYGRYDYGRHLRSPSPEQAERQSPSRGRVSPGYYNTPERQSPQPRYEAGGYRSPSKREASPNGRHEGSDRPRNRGRDSPQRDAQNRPYSPQRNGRYSPQRDQQGRRSPQRSSQDNGRNSPLRVSYEMDLDNRDTERYIVQTSTTTTTKTTRSTPSRRTPTKPSVPGGVSLGGSLGSGRKSPVKSALKKPPQATKSPGLPDKSVTMTGPRTYPLPGSEDPRTSQSMSEKGTRAFTPDQMNMEELLQSGYLSQTFSQSSTGRVPSPEYPQRQLSPTRLSKEKRSMGMTYSFESEGGAADSFSESELKRLADSDSLKMSVTLPSMDDSEFL